MGDKIYIDAYLHASTHAHERKCMLKVNKSVLGCSGGGDVKNPLPAFAPGYQTLKVLIAIVRCVCAILTFFFFLFFFVQRVNVGSPYVR